MEVFCEAESFFDRASDAVRNIPGALSSFSILEVDPPPPPPLVENPVDLAAEYVRTYLDTRETHDWLHVMVKAVSFERFWRAVLEAGSTRFLPFSCWCDGGRAGRQHRHMIAVAPKGQFYDIWKRVFPYFERRRRRKKMIRIESSMHLVHLLGCLSRRESRYQKNRSNLNHFYIFKSLPVRYKQQLTTTTLTG